MFVEIEPLIAKAKSIAGTTPFAVPLIIREMEKAKPADVAEVKHGEWKGESLTCSVCKRDISEIYDADSYMSYGIEDELKWCPFCGAKMDGGE